MNARKESHLIKLRKSILVTLGSFLSDILLSRSLFPGLIGLANPVGILPAAARIDCRHPRTSAQNRVHSKLVATLGSKCQIQD